MIGLEYALDDLFDYSESEKGQQEFSKKILESPTDSTGNGARNHVVGKSEKNGFHRKWSRDRTTFKIFRENRVYIRIKAEVY
ncbi:hypothetical protein Sjap_001067 [Stephania japonica]|uniref:Uncharacterized protein n=1 Tax=Stephania japonica TaxID=461633 RepID=A0AAP0KLJ8_9MAGN